MAPSFISAQYQRPDYPEQIETQYEKDMYDALWERPRSHDGDMTRMDRQAIYCRSLIPWTPEEDHYLISRKRDGGEMYRPIAKSLGRSEQACRLRVHNSKEDPTQPKTKKRKTTASPHYQNNSSGAPAAFRGYTTSTQPKMKKPKTPPSTPPKNSSSGTPTAVQSSTPAISLLKSSPNSVSPDTPAAFQASTTAVPHLKTPPDSPLSKTSAAFQVSTPAVPNKGPPDSASPDTPAILQTSNAGVPMLESPSDSASSDLSSTSPSLDELLRPPQENYTPPPDAMMRDPQEFHRLMAIRQNRSRWLPQTTEENEHEAREDLELAEAGTVGWYLCEEYEDTPLEGSTHAAVPGGQLDSMVARFRPGDQSLTTASNPTIGV